MQTTTSSPAAATAAPRTPTRWVLAANEPAAEGLREAGYGALSELLARRGVRTPEEAAEFLEPTSRQLHSPFLLAGMDQAVERLQRAHTNGERVVIVGDYDVDGVSSTALLLAVFRAVGIDVSPELPHRLRDGYGFQRGSGRSGRRTRAPASS